MILNIDARNVNTVYDRVVDEFFHAVLEPEVTRGGTVLRWPTPVCVTYRQSDERVLFNYYRDANPFFHFMEGLWMLGGRDDVSFLKQFNETIDQFSDDGTTLHGAYGNRWAHSFGFDQVRDVINHLRAYPTSRRVVMAMYNPQWDSLTAYNGKDVPCNTQLYFSPRGHFLDMTIMARSNDFVWGALGANAVHMSMLHEFVARATNFGLGKMYQFSNDYHMYIDRFSIKDLHAHRESPYDPYAANGYRPYPILADPQQFGRWLLDCEKFLDGDWNDLKDPFWRGVAIPMRRIWDCVATGEYERSGEELTQLRANDWSAAIWSWLKRRGSPTAP